jgi:hypothetical protein
MHLDEHEIAVFVAGAAEPQQQSRFAEHLAACEACAKTAQTYENLVGPLATTALEQAPRGLADDLWRRAHQENVVRPDFRKQRRTVLMPTFAAIAACAALAVFVPKAMQDDSSEFRAKGTVSDANGVVGFDVYRLATGAAEARLASGSMHMNEGLMFTIRNRGTKPASYLMIVAVDAKNDAFWYYPEFTSADSDPQSVKIEAADDVRLSDVVTHDLTPGKLTVYALFTDTPLRVSTIEAQVAAGSAPHAEGARVVSQTLEVMP